MKRWLSMALQAVLVAGFAYPGAAFYLDFEEGRGRDGGQITGVPGVTFTTSGGQTWRYCDAGTGRYNAYSVNLDTGWHLAEYYIYDYVAAWLGTAATWGRIDFDDQNGTWFRTGYCSASDFFLEAYDATDQLIDMAHGPANLRGTAGDTGDMEWLDVRAPPGSAIAYLILHDTGNEWEVDMMSGNMAGGYPVVDSGWTGVMLAVSFLAAWSLAAFGGRFRSANVSGGSRSHCVRRTSL